MNEAVVASPFPGFPDFRANVTFVPLQFFTLVLPRGSRGCVRIVGYALRKLLGWVDAQGNPTREQLCFTYRELIEEAGVSRDAIADGLGEAIHRGYLRCARSPRPDRAGQPARSGVYELCWDTEGRYTDSAAEFRGFYYPEAAVLPVQEANGIAHRPKAARKNIPNAFFDVLLPRERLSVIRVVGALLFYSIQWGPGGERKVPVQLSITELSRLTNLSRQHVHEAVSEARSRGYIEQVDPGSFHPQNSRAATYGIRWTGAVAAGRLLVPVGKGELVPPVGKGVRERSEKVNSDRSEKVNGIRIKTDLKTEQTTGEPAAAVSGLELLRQTGFDEPTARSLATRRSLAVIQRQIDWLPLRHSTRSRLGLLRRAIEQDWAKPEGTPQPGNLGLGSGFARHYYAAYHGNAGEPATDPLPKDAQIAARFVERLLALDADEKRVPDWGRQFGGMMRERHRNDPRARPYLASALVLYGDEFLRRLQQEVSARHTVRLEQAQEARHEALLPAYLLELGVEESRMQRAEVALYARFEAQRRLTRQRMSGGLFLASADTLAKFDSETSRLLAFAEFFHDRVPDFWQWEAKTRAGTPSGSVRLAGSLATEEAGGSDIPAHPIG